MVGCSVAKFTANEDYSNSVALSIKKGDRGFVAVNVLTHNGKNTEEFVFFLKIGWGEDRRAFLVRNLSVRRPAEYQQEKNL